MVKPAFFPFSGDSSKLSAADTVVVIGLGRFGTALALELEENGTQVLGIDADEDIVQSLNGRLTHVVRADSTNEEAMRQLGVHEFSHVALAVGTNLEASILTASMLLRFGIEHLWAKASSEAHGQILVQLGISHTVFPERDTGRRVAHLVRGSMLDFIPVDQDFAIVKTRVPTDLIGISLAAARLRTRHGVTVVAVRRGGKWTYAEPGTILSGDEDILVAGPPRQAERFGSLG